MTAASLQIKYLKALHTFADNVKKAVDAIPDCDRELATPAVFMAAAMSKIFDNGDTPGSAGFFKFMDDFNESMNFYMEKSKEYQTHAQPS